jgi:hypothetical protein
LWRMLEKCYKSRLHMRHTFEITTEVREREVAP